MLLPARRCVLRTILRVLLSVFLLCLPAACLLLPVSADAPPDGPDEALTTPDAFRALPDALPEELLRSLPEGLFSEDPAEAAEAAASLSGLPAILRVLCDAVGLRLPETARLLASLLGLVLHSALFRRVTEGLNGETGETLSFILRLTLFSATVALTAGTVEAVRTYLSALSSLTAGMLPVMGTLYALGGDLAEAAVNQSVLTAFLSALSLITSSLTPPVCGICLGLSLMQAVGGELRLSTLSGLVKKGYVFVVGLICFLLSTVLGLQTALTAGTDSLRMKGVKYAVGSMLPMVGSTLAGSLGTVAAGVRTLRSVCGVSGLLLLILLLLPTLTELTLYRAAVTLSASAAELLGCDDEAGLLREIAGLYGYLIAAVSLCSVLFLLALALFIKGTVALA